MKADILRFHVKHMSLQPARSRREADALDRQLSRRLWWWVAKRRIQRVIRSWWGR